MKQYITFSLFQDGFQNRKDNFTYEGLKALYNHFEEEEQNGIETEFDPIGICCEYTEYKDLEELQNNYSNIETMEELHDHTQVIEFKGGIIILDF